MLYVRMKELREKNNLTQNDVSKILGITRPQYSLYETGKRNIPIKLLMKLANYYKTSIDYIVGDTNIFERHL